MGIAITSHAAVAIRQVVQASKSKRETNTGKNAPAATKRLISSIT